ncbi:MAG: hypothetical protein KAH77_03635, partial [Thiomargarita sp.]|nr:hypothetical protein [Thiomargarita sp.]
MKQTFEITLNNDNIEKRQMATLPVFNWKLQTWLSYPKSFEEYYNDNFGFRRTLVSWYQYFKVSIFGNSPSKRIIIGKQGWLFFTDENVIEDYRNMRLFSKADLEQWRTSLESKWEWLKKQDIHYIFVIAPNKHTIYPEFLPDYINQIRKQSRTDQLITYLQQHTQVPIIDLRPALITAKQKHRTYHKTDTHWNNFGAYSAYSEIIKQLSLIFPKEHFEKSKEYNFQTEETAGGDLANMLGSNQLFKEVHINPVYTHTCAKRHTIPASNIPWFTGTEPYATYCNTAKQRVLMMGDSYSTAIAPYLSEQFQYIAYVRHGAKEAQTVRILKFFVKQEKPKLVIEERVERVLQYLPKKVYSGFMQTDAIFKNGIVLSLPTVKISETEFYNFLMFFNKRTQQFQLMSMIPIDVKTKYCATFSNTTGILHIPLVKVLESKQTRFYEVKLKRVISGSEWFQIEK